MTLYVLNFVLSSLFSFLVNFSLSLSHSLALSPSLSACISSSIALCILNPIIILLYVTPCSFALFVCTQRWLLHWTICTLFYYFCVYTREIQWNQRGMVVVHCSIAGHAKEYIVHCNSILKIVFEVMIWKGASEKGQPVT